MTEHTGISGECAREEIQELVEEADSEYYASSLGPPEGTKERAKKGLIRIQKIVREMKKMRHRLECPACHQEIERQIDVQNQGIDEIEDVWEL